MTKSRKWSLAVGAGVVVLVGGIWGYTTLNRAAWELDPSRCAARSTRDRGESVVATGKIGPITKVEIKSKANGIIEKLMTDVDKSFGPATCSSSSTRRTCAPSPGRLTPTFWLPRRRSRAPRRSSGRTGSKPKRRRSNSPGGITRAQSSCSSRSSSGLRRSTIPAAHSSWRRTEESAAQVQLGIRQAKVAEAAANVAQAEAAVERALESANTTRCESSPRAASRDDDAGTAALRGAP